MERAGAEKTIYRYHTYVWYCMNQTWEVLISKVVTFDTSAFFMSRDCNDVLKLGRAQKTVVSKASKSQNTMANQVNV